MGSGGGGGGGGAVESCGVLDETKNSLDFLSIFLSILRVKC